MKFAVKPYLQTVSVHADAVVDDAQYPYNIPALRNLGTTATTPVHSLHSSVPT